MCSRAFKDVPRKKGKSYSEKNIGRDLSWIETVAIAQKQVAEKMSGLQREIIIACPVCGSNNFQEFIEVYSFRYSECQVCSHLFIDNPPNAADVIKLYTADSDLQCCQSLAYNEDTFLKRLEYISKPKVDFVNQHMTAESESDEKGIWIDLGCAFGEMLTAARESGWKVRGVEADFSQAEHARKSGLDVIDGYVTADNAKSFLAGAQIVSAINTIEHVPNPLNLLKSINAAIEDGACLAVEVPRQPSLGSLANFIFPEYLYRQFCAPDHLHVFSEKSLELLLTKSGFKAEAIWLFGKDMVDFFSQSMLRAGNVSAAAQRFFDQFINIAGNQLQASLDNADFSDTMFVIARKDSKK